MRDGVGADGAGAGAEDAADALARFAKGRAKELGFHAVGVTDVVPSEHGDTLERWLAAGRHGEMAYMARPDAVARRKDPRLSLDGARSVIVVAHDYGAGGDAHQAGEDPHHAPPRALAGRAAPDREATPDRGLIARYARGRDYHKVVKRALRELLRDLDAEGRRLGLDRGVGGRAFVDTGPLLERELGRRAGLGWFGRNAMLIDPGRGSYFVLGALMVDVALPADAPFEADRCGSCRACLDACPTHALLGRDAQGAPVVHAPSCISYLTIELDGPIPEALRAPMGNRVFGCDICQEVCPFTIKFSAGAGDPSYAARGPGESPSGVEPDPTAPSAWHPGTASPPLVDLFRMALDAESWESFSRGSAIRRAGREGFARSVAVALGNWGDPSAVPVLSQGMKDPHPLVRAHAAWALGQVGSTGALETLRDGLPDEEAESVRNAIRRALEPSRARGRSAPTTGSE